MKGDEPGQFDDPVGPSIDVDRRVYFADRAARFVQKFDLRGTPLLSFENAAARGASAIAVDSGGAIYVADARAGAIQVFFPEGPLLRVLRVAPQRNLEGSFGFSVDADGRAYVPDPAEARIQVLSSSGRMERAWRVPFAAGNAAGRPIAAIAGRDGFVYVCDAGTARIVKFTATGEQVAAWQDPEGPGVALLGLAVASKYVFVLRAVSPHLQIWTTDGHPVLTDDLGGRLNASTPAKLSFAVDSRGDMIVLDSGVPRVLQFSIHLDFP
jgi:sugar lactone lactonase YvrE